MILLYILIFVVSFIVLALSSSWLVDHLSRLAKFWGLKEFVVAFFTMALAGTIPNFSVGISSVIHGIPELSFSEIIGGNIVDLTIAVALVVLVSKGGLSLSSRVVQGSAVFTLVIAILPLLLILDGSLTRIDGLILIFAFIFYVAWLFSKKERFSKTYDHITESIRFKDIVKSIITLLIIVVLLFVAAEGIVRSATYFSTLLNLPLVLIGVLVIGLGNALPEIFFGIQAARKGQSWMVIGNLMGAVIFPVTLVLGLVVLVSPIEITNFSPFVIGRFFLIISAVFFLLFLRTGRKITRNEAWFLLLLYFLFILAEVLFI